jgi:aspartate carbamoyltransferase regulatory subunit
MKPSTHKGLRSVGRCENETLPSNFEQVNDVLEVRDAEHDLHLKCNQCESARNAHRDSNI